MLNSNPLKEKTFELSKGILQFVRNGKDQMVISSINRQLVRSATSIGANYREAIESSSKKDFQYKISLCLKEANETNYWLSLLEEYYTDSTTINTIEHLREILTEIRKILGASLKTLRKN